MELETPCLDQHDGVMDIDDQVGLRPCGQLDLFLEEAVRFLDGLPIACDLRALRGGDARMTGRGQGEGRSERDERPPIAQIRK